MSDIRETPAHPSGWAEDWSRMVMSYDGFNEAGEDYQVDFAAEAVVCPCCRGRGHHVNPAIDSQGLSAEDFSEDPDFSEVYFSGGYDVTCSWCHGRNVILKITSEQGHELYLKHCQETADHYAEVEAERRFGC